jgi:hypothetical protein
MDSDSHYSARLTRRDFKRPHRRYADSDVLNHLWETLPAERDTPRA